MLTVKNTIIESWAVAVQWHITAMEYMERGIPNYARVDYFSPNIGRLNYAYQYWNSSYDKTYTSLFIDLVDGFNQNGQRFFGYSTVGINDNVTGYTLSGIESTFLHSVNGIDTWIGSLKSQLKANKPQGVTDGQIDELISQY